MMPAGGSGKKRAKKGAAFDSVGAQILASLTSGVLAVDGGGSVITVNETAREFLGVDESELLAGQALGSVPVTGPFVEIFEEVKSSGQAVQRRNVFLTYDNLSRRELGLSASPLEGTGPFNGVIFLFTDMTERRQLERAAHLNRQLADLGELTAGVVHELRTPVMVISGMSELILRQINDTATVQKHANTILHECRVLEGLIGQFLGFARPFDINATKCSPDEVARRAVKLCIMKAQQKSARIVPKIDDDLPVMHADAGKIVQVLVNLINNAIDAVEEGKGVINVFASAEGRQLVFEVVDNGPGLHLDDDADPFKPFVTQKEGGTGLGLSIVSRIVHAHKGAVTYRNSPTGGAHFTVRIPTGTL